MAPRTDLDLRDQLHVLRKRKWAVITAIVLTVGVSLALTLSQSETYQAQARLFIEPVGAGGSGLTDLVSLETEAQRLASVPVAQLVVDELDLTEGPLQLLRNLTVRPPDEDAAILNVTYTSEDPDTAAAVANAFADNYLEYRRGQAAAGSEEAVEAIRALLVETQLEVEEITQDLAQARQAGNADRVASLETQRATLLARTGSLQERLDEAQLSLEIEGRGGEVIQPAVAPQDPASPDLTRNLSFALIVGAAAGIGIALLMEGLDERFRGLGDVERAVGARVIGAIPHYRSGKRDAGPVLLAEPGSDVAEAYRSLRTQVEYLIARRGVRSFLVTSPAASEGKSATVLNLGVALAQAGRRVLLVSTDLRRPSLESSLGAGSTTGVAAWLSGGGALRNHIQETPVENLLLLATGPTPANPSELLASERMQELVRDLEQAFDVLLFDSPPLLPVADAGTIAGVVQGVILVVHAGSTTRGSASQAQRMLRGLDAPVLGVVLNHADPSAGNYGSYEGEGPSEPSPARPSEPKSGSDEGFLRRETDPPPPPGT